ncbi:MAG: SDR family oxidoreductase [Hyphomicrobium sp.]
MTHLLCFGLGYSAGVLARRLAGQGWTITGTSRTSAGAQHIADCGYRGMVFDGRLISADVSVALKSATHILLSIPPDNDGDPAMRAYGDDIAANTNVKWIGYFSTVGVYGDAEGGWVSEETEARPGSERGRRRLDAENAWRDLGRSSGKSVVVFRLPGIYGPGRSTIDDVRDGSARRLIKPGQVFNRIHVEDIASAVQAALSPPHADRVYNVTDDDPGPPQDVVAYAAGLLGLPVPPDLDFATTELSPMARSFYSESKRVSNARMKRELGVTLAYPSFRDGLSAIVRNSR